MEFCIIETIKYCANKNNEPGSEEEEEKKQEKLFPVKTRNNSAKRISISLTIVIAPKD